jgi:hypothetical protein
VFIQSRKRRTRTCIWDLTVLPTTDMLPHREDLSPYTMQSPTAFIHRILAASHVTQPKGIESKCLFRESNPETPVCDAATVTPQPHRQTEPIKISSDSNSVSQLVMVMQPTTSFSKSSSERPTASTNSGTCKF